MKKLIFFITCISCIILGSAVVSAHSYDLSDCVKKPTDAQIDAFINANPGKVFTAIKFNDAGQKRFRLFASGTKLSIWYLKYDQAGYLDMVANPEVSMLEFNGSITTYTIPTYDNFSCTGTTAYLEIIGSVFNPPAYAHQYNLDDCTHKPWDVNINKFRRVHQGKYIYLFKFNYSSQRRAYIFAAASPLTFTTNSYGEMVVGKGSNTQFYQLDYYNGGTEYTQTGNLTYSGSNYYTEDNGFKGTIISPVDGTTYTNQYPDILVSVQNTPQTNITLYRLPGGDWNQKVMVDFWSLDSSGGYVEVQAGQIPYQANTYGIEVVASTGGTPVRVVFTIQETQQSLLEITGVDNNSTIAYYPNFWVRKKGPDYQGQYDVVVNGKIVRKLPAGDCIINFLASEMPYQVGSNTIQVKDEGGNVIKSVAFKSTRDNVPGSEGDWFDKPDAPDYWSGKPIPPTSNDWLEWLSYYTKLILYYMSVPFRLFMTLVQNISDIINGMLEGMEGIKSVLSSFFGWLPPEITALLTVGFAMVIILRIVGR